MTDLSHVEQLVPLDHGLSVIVTLRPDHTPQTSVVNAGVMTHPVTGAEVRRVRGRRPRPQARPPPRRPDVTVVVRAGWQWAAVEGTAELIGPDDPHADVDDERLATTAPRDLHRCRRHA